MDCEATDVCSVLASQTDPKFGGGNYSFLHHFELEMIDFIDFLFVCRNYGFEEYAYVYPTFVSGAGGEMCSTFTNGECLKL